MHIPTDEEMDELERELRKPLSGYLVRSPKAEDTQLLLLDLHTEFEALKANKLQSHSASFAKPPVAGAVPSFFKLIRSQFLVYTKSFWLASLAMFIMLILVSGTTLDRIIGVNNAFALLLPLMMLSGIGYSMKTWNPAMRMLESITPYPPALLLLSRWTIIIAMNTLFGLLGTFFLSVTQRSMEVLPFLLSWLAPLLFLSGLLGYLLLWKGTVPALAAAAGGWLIESMLQERAIYLWSFSGKGIVVWEASLLAAGILLLVFTFRRSMEPSRLAGLGSKL